MDRVLLKGALAELFDEGAARFDASMAELTTFRIGGPADVLVEPRTAGEARVVLEACRRLGVAVRVMGLGSDVLVADEGLRCVVVRIAESLSQVEVDGERMHVEAGRTPTGRGAHARRGLRDTSSPAASRAPWAARPS